MFFSKSEIVDTSWNLFDGVVLNLLQELPEAKVTQIEDLYLLGAYLE